MQVCLHGCELHVEGSVNRTEMHGALRRAQRVYMSPRTLGQWHRFHVDAKDSASSGCVDVKAQGFIPRNAIAQEIGQEIYACGAVLLEPILLNHSTLRSCDTCLSFHDCGTGHVATR